MSITFQAVGAPRVVLDEYECSCVHFNDGTPHPECDCDDGVTTYTEAEGSLNVSNASGAALLRTLGLPDECYGEIERSSFPAVRRAIMRALSLSSVRAPEIEDAYELEPGHAGTRVVRDEGGTARIQSFGPRVVSFGRTDESILRRVRALAAMLDQADRLNTHIVWS